MGTTFEAATMVYGQLYFSEDACNLASLTGTANGISDVPSVSVYNATGGYVNATSCSMIYDNPYDNSGTLFPQARRFMEVPGVPGVYSSGCYAFNNRYRVDACVDIDVLDTLRDEVADADDAMALVLGMIPIDDTALFKDHVLSGATPDIAIRVEVSTWTGDSYVVCGPVFDGSVKPYRQSAVPFLVNSTTTCEEAWGLVVSFDEFITNNATQKASLVCDGQCVSLTNESFVDARERDGIRIILQSDIAALYESFWNPTTPTETETESDGTSVAQRRGVSAWWSATVSVAAGLAFFLA